jgi:hypothetical protein
MKDSTTAVDVSTGKQVYSAPRRVRFDDAARLTAGVHTSLCDILGSGRHNETPDNAEEPAKD